MKITLEDNGKEVEISDALFGEAQNRDLVHQLVNGYQAGLRQGTKAQKNRSAVKASGVKPWKQKGSGRARAGSKASPLWRSGGVTFAQREVIDYTQKINKKMYKKAMRVIFSRLLHDKRIVVVSEVSVTNCKTKEMLKFCGEIGFDSGLIITEAENQAHTLSSRNLKDINLLTYNRIDPVSLMKAKKICITQAALKNLEERFA